MKPSAAMTSQINADNAEAVKKIIVTGKTVQIKKPGILQVL